MDEMRGKNEDKGFKMNDKKTKIVFAFFFNHKALMAGSESCRS